MNLPVLSENRLPVMSVALQRAITAQERWEISVSARPVPVSAEVRDAARKALPALTATMRRASDGTVKKWLASLGVLTAGKVGAADARAKITAYAAMLEHPEMCFTGTSLKTAARAFKWFPSYSEVAEFLDGECREERAALRRLKRIAEGPVADEAKPNPDRKRVGAGLQKLSNFLRGAGPKPKKMKVG
jgi:hypothetical protein